MTSWWKPIETGGLYSCKDCPQSIQNNTGVSELRAELEMWKKIADRLAEDGYFHSSAGIEAKNLYDKATGWSLR